MVFIAAMTKENLVKKLFSVAERIHLRIFGHAMSDEMRRFLGHLSWSFSGGIIAAGIMFAVNILAGRWLGPEEYGKYNAALSFATILSTIYLFGMDVSSVRYLSDRKFSKLKRKIFTTVLLSVIFLQLIVILILFLVQKNFPNVINISNEIFLLAVLLAIVISHKALANGFLRAFHEFKRQGIYRILDAGVVLIAFFVAVLFFGQRNMSSYANSFLLGGAMFVLFSLWSLRKNISEYDLSILKKMFSEYNRYVLFLSLIGIIVASDKLIIGRFLGFKELGYYSAYYASSHLFVAELGGIFMNVFWPSVIKNSKSIQMILRKVVRLFVFGAPFWVILISASTFSLISLFGKGYPIRYDYLVLFSMNTFLGFLFSIFTGFLNVHHIKKSVVISGVFAFSSILTLFLTQSILSYICLQIALQVVLICVVNFFLSSEKETIIATT